MHKESDKPFKYRNKIQGKPVPSSNRTKRYTKLAQNIATNSKYGKLRHGAILFKGGSIINTAFNKDSYSSFGERFRDSEYGPATHHAELSCITGVSRSKTNGASVFVVRVNRNGELRMSKPCAMCHNALKFAGIKKVYYSTNDGTIEMYKL